MVLHWISEKRVSGLILKKMIILQELKGERRKNQRKEKEERYSSKFLCFISVLIDSATSRITDKEDYSIGRRKNKYLKL